MSSFVQGDAETTGGSAGTTVSKPFPSNTTAGNFLILFARSVVSGTSHTVTGLGANTWVKQHEWDDGSTHMSIWTVSNCAGGAETPQLVTGSSGFPRICFAEYNTTLQTYDSPNHSTNTGSGTAFDSGNIAPAATENLFGVIQNSTNNSEVVTPGSGWTQRETPSGDGNFFMFDKLDAAPGTQSFNGSYSNSASWEAAVYAFKSASAAAKAPVVCVMQ